MRNLNLSNSFQLALLDDDIYEIVLMQGPWRLHHKGYVLAGQHPNQRWLHHQILPMKEGFEVDHINGDKLNNTRANLRYSTHSQNLANRKVQANNICGYKGVRQKGKKWQARITVQKVSSNLGHFNTAEEAALAYNKKAVEVFGAFAVLNIIT